MHINILGAFEQKPLIVISTESVPAAETPTSSPNTVYRVRSFNLSDGEEGNEDYELALFTEDKLHAIMNPAKARIYKMMKYVFSPMMMRVSNGSKTSHN